MTTIEAKVPDYLAALAQEAAVKEKTTLDQIVAVALSAQLSAWKVREDMEMRAKRGRRLLGPRGHCGESHGQPRQGHDGFHGAKVYRCARAKVGFSHFGASNQNCCRPRGPCAPEWLA